MCNIIWSPPQTNVVLVPGEPGLVGYFCVQKYPGCLAIMEVGTFSPVKSPLVPVTPEH